MYSGKIAVTPGGGRIVTIGQKSRNFFKKRCLQVFTGSGGPRVDLSESCTNEGHIRRLSL
jgi:hypothetical protein